MLTKLKEVVERELVEHEANAKYTRMKGHKNLASSMENDCAILRVLLRVLEKVTG